MATPAKTSGVSAGRDIWYRLGDVESRNLVKTLAFKLQVVAGTLVDTLSSTPPDAETTTLQHTQGGV